MDLDALLLEAETGVLDEAYASLHTGTSPTMSWRERRLPGSGWPTCSVWSWRQSRLTTLPR
jgi:hypothetical protein